MDRESEGGKRRDKKGTAEEIKRKVKGKGQPPGSTTDVLLPTQNPLWVKNHVGKEQKGRRRVEQ